MGVALIISWCASPMPFCRNASRCATPKRCCSSTIASPSCRNVTSSWNSACVPMAKRAAPLSIATSAFLRSFAGRPPDNHAISIGKPSSHEASFR